MGRGDVGRGDVGTWGCGTQGRRDADVPINKQHLKFALNLQFTFFGGKGRERYYVMESLTVADDFQRP